MSTSRNDRIAGVLVGLGAGDALGAGYEFGPAFDGPVEMKGGGPFNWEVGEWTDDTQMAICIAENLSTGSLDLAALGDWFIQWSRECKDIGNQTRAVLSRASNGASLPDIAATHHLNHPNSSAGNGSLMRTGPVALAFLGDNDAIAEAAADISALTHADPLAIDACVLWSISIAEAIETGEIPDIRSGLAYIPSDHRSIWDDIITSAETKDPRTFNPNGFVVTAFQAAWSSIIQTPVPERRADHLRLVLENTVRIGNDTDTTAAIAGGMLGAIYGVSAIPLEWKTIMAGWPGIATRDLVRLAALTATGGVDDSAGWPANPNMDGYYRTNFPQGPIAEPLADDPGVIVGNIAGIEQADTDIVVSLCRMGSEPVSNVHIDVRLIDEASPGANPNLEFVIDDTVRFIASQRDTGRTVYVHCVRAESRTPTVAAAYLATTLGISGVDALERVRQSLPNADPNPGFVTYLNSLTRKD
ncbi:MAG: ADP-ribosylglycohydrolase family protein [Actinomycetia bacterium]|nr:ADP-ribosylglycohydrolase family protein [Actinomycetes bacterium]